MKIDRQSVNKAVEASKQRFTRNNTSKATNPYQKKGKSNIAKKLVSSGSIDSDYSDNEKVKSSVVSPNSSKTNDKTHSPDTDIPRDIKYTVVLDKNDDSHSTKSQERSKELIIHSSSNKSKNGNGYNDDTINGSKGKNNVKIIKIHFVYH